MFGIPLHFEWMKRKRGREREMKGKVLFHSVSHTIAMNTNYANYSSLFHSNGKHFAFLGLSFKFKTGMKIKINLLSVWMNEWIAEFDGGPLYSVPFEIVVVVVVVVVITRRQWKSLESIPFHIQQRITHSATCLNDTRMEFYRSFSFSFHVYLWWNKSLISYGLIQLMEW